MIYLLSTATNQCAMETLVVLLGLVFCTGYACIREKNEIFINESDADSHLTSRTNMGPKPRLRLNVY